MLPFTREECMENIELGYISRKVHHDNEDVVILNYTDSCVYDKVWNNVTINCRGIILNERTGEVLARPFPKFFNLGEIEGQEKLIPKNEIPLASEKFDGSLGISYKMNGKVKFATRGSFISEQSQEAERIWNEKYSDSKIPDNITLLVEIISPVTKVVVDYKGRTDLVLLGAIDRHTGKELKYQELKNVKPYKMQLTSASNMSTKQVINIIKEFKDHNHEGFVLHWESTGLRFKVKSPKYLEVHRLVCGVSDKQKYISWAGDNLIEYIKLVPDEFRKELEELNDKLDDIYLKIVKKLFYYSFFWNIKKHVNKDDRKEFALWVKEIVDKNYQGFVFKAYDGKDIESNIKEYIAKNYKLIEDGSFKI